MTPQERELNKVADVRIDDVDETGNAVHATRQRYLQALVVKIGNMSTAQWNGLSKAAHDWANPAIRAYNIGDNEIIPDFPGGGPEPSEVVKPPELEAKLKAKGKNKAVESEPAAPARKGRAGRDDDEGGSEGVLTSVKMLLLENPDYTVPELKEKLKEKGLTSSPMAISSVRSSFRHTLRVLKDAGYLKKMPGAPARR